MKTKKTYRNKKEISRRDFIGGAAAAAVFTIVPGSDLAGAHRVPPSGKINLGCIGVGDRAGGANFEYSGLVTQALLLGNFALRIRRKLYWDGPNFKVTNLPEADKYLHFDYRRPWTL